jgi:hypothetical protein
MEEKEKDEGFKFESGTRSWSAQTLVHRWQKQMLSLEILVVDLVEARDLDLAVPLNDDLLLAGEVVEDVWGSLVLFSLLLELLVFPLHLLETGELCLDVFLLRSGLGLVGQLLLVSASSLLTNAEHLDGVALLDYTEEEVKHSQVLTWDGVGLWDALGNQWVDVNHDVLLNGHLLVALVDLLVYPVLEWPSNYSSSNVDQPLLGHLVDFAGLGVVAEALRVLVQELVDLLDLESFVLRDVDHLDVLALDVC